MKHPLISIIVPCYKVEKFLDRCMESLIKQTLKEIEIILIDDLSPDSTPVLCDRWGNKDERIKVIHKKRNEGLGFARNTGLDYASGDYVMFLDSDDTFELDTCERMYKTAVAHNADVVTGNFITEVSPGIWVTSHEQGGDRLLNEKEIINYTLDVIASAPYIKPDRLHPVSVCLLCMRRSIIKNHNLRFYSEREIASEDTLFKIAFLRRCKVMVCLDYPFYHYFHNQNSLTHSFKPEAFIGMKTLRKKLIEITSNDKDALQRINRFVISDIRMHLTRLINSDYNNKYNYLIYILNDEIWKELSSFKPSYYGLYARFFHWLCLTNSPRFLYLYMFLTSHIRNFLNSK